MFRRRKFLRKIVCVGMTSKGNEIRFRREKFTKVNEITSVMKYDTRRFAVSFYDISKFIFSVDGFFLGG